ncbi:hypothetical protein F7725_024188 [Dissostichus mawsoni]|uniref:Uncharacterized protein n=1 Tax=Dissostichus mawsoni TaxID=36200 RepID=A0A7J5Y0N9_DISMA|nr:hypothetical protein F7725_024188 [Dissostichus mawsoni]
MHLAEVTLLRGGEQRAGLSGHCFAVLESREAPGWFGSSSLVWSQHLEASESLSPCPAVWTTVHSQQRKTNLTQFKEQLKPPSIRF